MPSKFLIFVGMTVGSIIGGYLPTIFGIDAISYTSVLTSSIGAVAGIIIAYKFSSG